MPSHSESQLPGLPGYDPDNIQPWIVEVVSSMTVLAFVSVVLRIVARRLKDQKLWWDDWLLLFSMGWNFIVVGFIFAMYSCGMGIHADLVDPDDIVMMAKWLVVAEILYAFNLGWTKLSLLLMYYRIFRVPYFKKMAWAVGVFVMAWVVCITFLFIFICVPVEKLWYPHLPGRCINQVGTWIANAASTILTDLIILLMPLPQIWKLQLAVREKVGLTAAFSIGFFVVFASAYRTSVLFTYSDSDPTYTLAPTVGWTAIEMSAGITSACLPTLLPVANAIARRLGIKSPLGKRRAAKPSKEPGMQTGASSRDVLGSGKRGSDHFYRLPDETDSSDAPAARTASSTPIQSKLRPDGKDYEHEYTVTTSHSKPEESEDDIPLQGIRVKKAFERSTIKR